MPFTRDNHYVPRLYLKHFASADGNLFRYRTLVSRVRVPAWKPINVGRAGYQAHLYTRALAQGDSDEIELWLNKEFETPAKRSISKVVNNERLHKDDYRLLVRFLAAQIVRTPAHLIENLPIWRESAQRELGTVSKEIKKKFTQAKAKGEVIKSERMANAKYLPLRVTKVPADDGKSVLIKTETAVGRGMWIFEMRHVLTNTLNRLLGHRWTIVSAEDDLPWFTTDDPVVRLNFKNEHNYDFKGGWGSPNTNIFLPLSPRHLLLTQVGKKGAYQRGDLLPRPMAIMLRKMIAEHAFRYIFAPIPDPTIAAYRPRTVNAQAVEHERNEWRNWHKEQSAIERELLGSDNE
jgi:Protein of unknown function (DUF4238)